MSIKVMTRVWEHAQYKEGTLLVLLALADYADDRGVCWPAQPEIASKARLTDRQVRNVINQLVEDGEILVQPSQGRGKPARYCVLSGLTDAEKQERRKSFPGNNFQEIKTWKSETKKAEIGDKKGGNQLHTKYLTNDAPESVKPAPPKNDNRHEPSEPSPPPENEPRKRQVTAAAVTIRNAVQKQYGIVISGKKAQELAALAADGLTDIPTVIASFASINPNSSQAVSRLLSDLVATPPEPGKPYARAPAKNTALADIYPPPPPQGQYLSKDELKAKAAELREQHRG